MRRLKSKDIAGYRKKRIDEIQICPLCNVKLDEKSHLDHDHKNGQIRDVLHAGCNRALGKLENALRMVPNAFQFLNNIQQYIIHHQIHPSGVFHPTWKTKDEKRILRNKRNRRKRRE